MRSRQRITLRIVVLMASWLQTSYAQLEIPGQPTIYNESQEQYLQADGLDNPLRAGAYAAIKNPDGVGDDSQLDGIQWIDKKIESFADAKSQTLKIINNMINYALASLSLVALIYLIYHGFIILTAAGDDAKYKEGMKGIRYALIAIGWIGLSWILVSTIFWIVSSFAGGKTPEWASITTSITTTTRQP